MNDATLDNFFSRPIKIAEQEWSTSTTLAFDIDPWSLYFENPRVINRIANYHLLRCNLHVRIIINGNGFQYGRVLVGYLPFQQFDNMTTAAALIQSDLVQVSQWPRVFLDPTTSTGGDMTLPFCYFRNYIQIPLSNWDQMGQLYFRSLNPLKHANGATDVVTVSVFAWAEDVQMSVLTSVEPTTIVPQSGSEFEPQSGEIDEANTKGFISGKATAIAKMASYFTKIPYIGPFAMATEVAGTAIGKISQMFGYCRPPQTQNPDPYRPTVSSHLAVTNIPDTAHKLTVDHKQELSVDPRIAGLGGVDPLNIKEIAKRESYLTTFPWRVGDPPETLLWNGRIDPVTWSEDTGPPVSFHFPACAVAAMPFQYWTGTMRFRFQVVCSNYHKGRLKFVYDPNFFATNEYNTNYLRIVDIADETDITIEIGNGQDVTLLDHHLPGVASVTQMYSTTPYASKEEGNGVIGVYIVNELTVPNSTVNNDIEVNVFVSMGDDFEVFVPFDHFQNFTFGAEPQSGFEPQSGMMVDAQSTKPNEPQHSGSYMVGPGLQDTELINKVFTGEAITSFRTMLKRYNLHTTLWAGTDDPAVGQLLQGRHPQFPYLRGYVTGAINTATGGPYNFCNTVLLHWVRYAFSGWRGSIRWKLLPRGVTTPSDYALVQRSKLNSNVNYSEASLPIPQYTSQDLAARDVVIRNSTLPPQVGTPPSGFLGSTLTFNSVNGALEFEMPFYSPVRFNPGKNQDMTSAGNGFEASWDYYIQMNGEDPCSVYDVYTAIGEDFQCYFYTGLPRMYYEPIPPFAA